MGFFCFPSVFSHSCFLVGCLDCLEVEAWQVGPMGTSGGRQVPVHSGWGLALRWPQLKKHLVGLGVER